MRTAVTTRPPAAGTAARGEMLARAPVAAAVADARPPPTTTAITTTDLGSFDEPLRQYL